MKNLLLFVSLVSASTILAQAQSEPAITTESDTQPATVVVAPLTIEPPVLPDDRWATKDSGVIGQFINAPSWLEPINVLAKPESGYGEQNLGTDAVTGRVMGLNLITFNF